MGMLDNVLKEGKKDIIGGLEGLKILIYGGNTLGKTPQAMNFPKPLLLMGESGGSAIAGYKVPMHKKADFVNITNELSDKNKLEKNKEDFNTIVIDCIEDIVNLYETHICKEYGVSDVGQIQQADKGNPNGYAVYRREFKQQINKLASCGYTIIFISHEEIEEIKDENDQVVKRWTVPKGSVGTKGSCRFIRDLCDFRFYIKGNGVDEETGKAIMSTAYCVQTKDFYAGSRYDIQSYINPFTANNVITAIKKAQELSAANQGGIVKDFKVDTSSYTKKDYLKLIKPYFSKLNKLFEYDVTEIVESQLGEKVRISQATDEQLVQLEVIYTNLLQLACDRGIVVDTNEEE